MLVNDKEVMHLLFSKEVVRAVLLENSLLELTLLDRAGNRENTHHPLKRERVLGQQCEHQTGSENRGKDLSEKNLGAGMQRAQVQRSFQRGHSD